jgi:cytochrome P450 family 6
MWLAIILLFLITSLIWWIYDHQSYFKKHNVKYLKSIPFLGFISDNLLNKKSAYNNYLDIYNNPEFKDEPFFGIFIFHKPALMVKDPELIKKIMVTDFTSFGSRYAGSDTHDPIGCYQLFMAKYPVWKNIRTKLSPFFSGAKLKAAYYLINKLGNDLNQYIHNRLENDKVELNLKPLTDLFFVDVVTSVAFGVEAHSLEHSGSEFQLAANSIFKFTAWRGFELISNFLLPQVMRLFNFKNMSHYTTDFIYRVTPEIIAAREKSGYKRNDLIDMLIELKNELKPEIEGHTTNDMLYAQVAIFLAAGKKNSNLN